MTDYLRAARSAFIAVGLVVAALHAMAAGGDSAAIIVDGDDNLVLMGGRVSPPRAVPGNLAAAGGRIVINKEIGHNAALAGGAIEVQAPVGGKLAAAGGTVTVESAIGGNLALAGGEIRVGKSAVVAKNASLLGARIEVEGTVSGNLHAEGESLTINGMVQGDVEADVERLVLGPGARVGGNVRYASLKDIEKAEGATVGGKIERRGSTVAAHAEAADKALAVVGWIATVMVFLFVLGAGAIFLAVAPIFSVEAPDRLRTNPGKSLGMGLLTVIGAPIVAVLFMITIVGIPVGVMIFALYPLALLLGFVVGVLWFANWATQLAKQPPPATVTKAIGYFALALLVVSLVSKVPVLGGILAALLLLMGVGAFEVELFRRMRSGSGARSRVEVERP